MYNLIEYSGNYSKTSSLWQYGKDTAAANNNSNIVDFGENNLNDSVKFNKHATFLAWAGVLARANFEANFTEESFLSFIIHWSKSRNKWVVIIKTYWSQKVCFRGPKAWNQSLPC